MSNPMDRPEAIISDEAIEAVWGGADFGPHLTKREVIRNTLLKFACGWSSGKTAHLIVAELNLAAINKQTLTKLGQKYLWACYSKQNGGELEQLKAENSKMRNALEEARDKCYSLGMPYHLCKDNEAACKMAITINEIGGIATEALKTNSNE